MFYVLLIISFISQLSFAQNTVSTQENTTVVQDVTTSRFNENVAVVAWTGFNDSIFKNDPILMKGLFTDPDGAFRAKLENYITIDMDADFPEGFASKIKEAVNLIKDKDNPILIMALSSHGSEGYIIPQNKDLIAYDVLAETIIANTFNVNNKMTLMLFVESCYSGSIIPVIKTKLACSNEYQEKCFTSIDGGRYKNKMEIYTSAPSNDSSPGGQFLKILNAINKIDSCKSEGCGFNDLGKSTFLALDGNMLTSFWNSFEGENKKFIADATDIKNAVGNKTIINGLINMLKNAQNDIPSILNLVSPDLSVGASAIINRLGKIANGDKDAITTLINVIKDDKNNIYDAIEALGNIAIGDNEAIKTIIDVLKNRKGCHDVIFEALGKIAFGNKDAINALISVLKKSDGSEIFRVEAVRALGKIADGDAEATATLTDLSINDEDSEVRKAALEALKK